jgi:hypothetical protein
MACDDVAEFASTSPRHPRQSGKKCQGVGLRGDMLIGGLSEVGMAGEVEVGCSESAWYWESE